MDVTEAIRLRRSVRDYKPDDVPDAILSKLIEAACWAPSATNEQPWTFTVIKNKQMLDSVSDEAKALMRKSGGTALPERLARQLADHSVQIFHNAPVLIVISTHIPTRWATEDCALAAQNLMLAAYREGLGSCWIGMAQEWLNAPEGRKRLNVPMDGKVVAPIIVGYPNTMPSDVPRQAPRMTWLG